MLDLESSKPELYSHIIHNFLDVEVFGKEKGLDKIIRVMPEHLRREQYNKCKTVFKELYSWSGDKIYHYLDAFHQMVLYKFLEHISNKQYNKNFRKKYFDAKANSMILEAAKIDFNDQNDFVEYKKSSLNDCIDYYYNVYSYADFMFEDTDFLMIDNIYNEISEGSNEIAKSLGINIDYYLDLFPEDIREKYSDSCINLSSNISKFLDFIIDNSEYGNLAKMFWDKDEKVSSEHIQLFLDNLLTSFYCKTDLEILWNSNIENDMINFNFFQRRVKNKNVLVQFRTAGKHLREGYEQQLLEQSRNYDTAYYIIMCFNDEDYERAEAFIDSYVYTENYISYINIYILDVRRKLSASKLR